MPIWSVNRCTSTKIYKKTLPTFEKRYNVLVNQMEIRKAPQKQIEQLKKIKQRYEQIVEKTNGKEI